MAVESADDRSSFVDPDDFGATAVYVTAAGAESEIDGIFDERPSDVFSDPGVLAAGPPTFRCPTASLPSGAAREDTLIINGTAFAVAGIEHDGTGMSTIKLEEEGP